jgi:hypothetical protein
MRKFMTTNCVGVTVNKVVMKVPYPQYHNAYPTKQKIFWPPASSPFFTEVIAKMPKNIKYHIYPMLVPSTRGYWKSWAGTASVGYAVFSFVKQWNRFLVGNGYAGMEGLVVDVETVIPSDGLSSAAGVNRLKAQFPGVKFGAAIGFDDSPKLRAMRSYTDHFFLEMYDWYRPTQFITLTARSPFVVSKNNPAAISTYLMKTAIDPVLWREYVAAGTSKLHMMWSLQHAGTDCINMQGTGNCGTRNDFGAWSPAGFNAFLVKIKATIAGLGIPALNQMQHGVFHYNALPRSWL